MITSSSQLTERERDFVRGTTNLTETEFEIFKIFADLYDIGNPFTLRDVAEIHGTQRQAVWEIKNKLVEYGLIARKPNANKRWKLTQLGKRLWEKIEKAGA